MKNLVNPQQKGFYIEGGSFMSGSASYVIDGRSSTYITYNPTSGVTYIQITFNTPVLVKSINVISGNQPGDRYENGAYLYLDGVKSYMVLYGETVLPEYRLVKTIKIDFIKQYYSSYSYPSVSEIEVMGREDSFLLQDTLDENKVYGLSGSNLILAEATPASFMQKGFELPDLFKGSPRPIDQAKTIVPKFKILTLKK